MIKLGRSFAFKLLVIAFTVFISAGISIYLIEKNAVGYTYDDKGQKVDKPSNIKRLEEGIWWTFVTSSTVGYGDYFPVSKAGRLIGIFLMFFGVSLIGVITGNIASSLVERQLKEERGLKDIKMKNHFIICGWKREMGLFLRDIIGKNKSFLASEIVLINTASPDDIENIKSDSEFSQISFIHGDYIDERVLHRANLKEAKKVLVLADRLVQGSVQEIDSRTVMTIITIKSISKHIYAAAELLDSKFERYLSSANCDEIILSSEYNRSLIANASAGSGISHVISELLDVHAPVAINTREIPTSFIGKKYSDLLEHFHKDGANILIGILENTGNFYVRKKEAIEEAQKTPDISKLVDSLKIVKTLQANQPVINPLPDYVVKKHSKAIIIEGRTRS